jgi:DNA repair exonuclease SbcCD nuclease subunit
MSKGGSGKGKTMEDIILQKYGHDVPSPKGGAIIIGDCHLAPRQYGLQIRRDDIFSTLRRILNEVSLSPANIVVLAGDFFDKRKVEADTFTRALDILKSLYHHYIFVEGNHDRALMRDEKTWIEALTCAIYQDVVQLRKKSYTIAHTDKRNLLLICTLDYSGTDTKEALATMISEIKYMDDNTPTPVVVGNTRNRILVAHFGLTEYAGGPISGTISMNDPVFVEARKMFDAIFLGHIHKQYSLPAPTDKSLCPVYGLGSIETLGFDEIEDFTTFYEVLWLDGIFRVNRKTVKRARPFLDIQVNVEGATSPTEYFERMVHEIIPASAGGWGKFDKDTKTNVFENAIVRLTLNGEVAFDRLKLNIPKIRDRLIELTKATHIIIRNRLTRKGEISRSMSANTTRGEMEKASVKAMADPAYSVHNENLANLVSEVKDEVDKGVAPDKLFELIMGSRLMEDVVNDNKASDTD